MPSSRQANSASAQSQNLSDRLNLQRAINSETCDWLGSFDLGDTVGRFSIQLRIHTSVFFLTSPLNTICTIARSARDLGS